MPLTMLSSSLDWDKVRIFYTAAEAGSFTHAGDALGLSQSAVSRQVGALERDLSVPLFHRHARGLILTEQGELLFRTAKEMMLKLEATRSRLSDSRERPNGDLRVTTTLGLGANWLTPRLGEFLDLYSEVRVQVLLTDEELDLSMREADVAIWLRQPVQGDLIQRRLFTVHFHAYASPEYIKGHGQPKDLSELEEHRILTYGGVTPSYLMDVHWLTTVGRDPKNPRTAALTVNNITALKRAVERGIGIAVLPDYLVEADSGLVQVLNSDGMPSLDSYLVYPEEMKNVARVQVFRDFLVSKAQRWTF
ncbi:LysR family transcriptional regulator [Alsobacter sp. SYSU M60028]|uniref:LysR family transcriptional regulator n=1 Tax=Alsobacter ponti TaxID=2962936 RepID=A0ABT1L6M8_9HYPH|nr:LysR family transcriptional regulator [Alsobacter ponti]MCP8937060.1 LysR family transcriptional regulator [Alsobacter ponti]